MYPLKVILIGCDESALPHVRRELMNVSAQLEAEFDGVGAAIAVLRASQNEKRLLLIHIKEECELENLERLSNVLNGWPILALIDVSRHSSQSVNATLLAAMRAGASQIVTLPLVPADFKAAVDRLETQFVFSSKEPCIIAVAGATGGCGTTTIAVNLAYEIAHRRNLRCILVDLSLKMGMVATYLNVEPEYTILDLLRDSSRVDTLLVQRVLIKVAQNFEILAGSDRLTAPITVSPHEVSLVIDTVSQIADVVVLDVPSTYDDVFFEVLAGARTAVLIGEQKIPSIRALKQVREALGRGDTGQAEHLVINRYNPKVSGFDVDHLLAPLGVSTLAAIAGDTVSLTAAVNRGCPLRLESPRSRTLSDIDALADTLITGSTQQKNEVGNTGLFGRLRRAFANS